MAWDAPWPLGSVMIYEYLLSFFATHLVVENCLDVATFVNKPISTFFLAVYKKIQESVTKYYRRYNA